MVGVGEAESPGVVDEEDVGVLGHEVGGKDETPLTTVAGFDSEMGTAVEGIRREFPEKLVVQRLGKSRRRE